jgi:hypothetical protein
MAKAVAQLPRIGVTAEGAWIPDTVLRDVFGLRRADVRKALTHTKKMFQGPPLVARGFRFVDVPRPGAAKPVKYTVLPRGRAQALAATRAGSRVRWRSELPARTAGTMREELLAADVETLMPNQRVMVDHAYAPGGPLCKRNVKRGTSVLYMVAGAGTGKTHTGVELGRRSGGRFAVICSRLAIAKQWRNVAADYVPGARVMLWSEVRADRRAEQFAESDIVVVTPSSALEWPAEIWSQLQAMVIDEIQQFCSKKWRTLTRAPVPIIVGLTATHDERPDTMDCVAHWALGKPVVAAKLPGYDRREVRFAGRATFVRRSEVALAAELVGDYSERVGVLATWGPRVRAKSELVRELLLVRGDELRDLPAGLEPPTVLDPAVHVFAAGIERADRLCVLVFAERRAEVEALVADIGIHCAAELGRGGVVGVAPPDDDLGAAAARAADAELLGLKGGATEEEIAAALAGARVVVTTYSYSSVGVSLDHMTAMVLDCGRKSHAYQIFKRTMRARSDTTIIRRYLHLVDEDDKNMRTRRAKHKSVYTAINCAVSERKVVVAAA